MVVPDFTNCTVSQGTAKTKKHNLEMVSSLRLTFHVYYLMKPGGNALKVLTTFGGQLPIYRYLIIQVVRFTLDTKLSKVVTWQICVWKLLNRRSI